MTERQLTEEEKAFLKPFKDPRYGKFVTYDQAYAYTDEQDQTNTLLNIGFEPYAITPEPDMRPETKLKMAAGGMGLRYKQWFKRCREIPANAPILKGTENA